MYGMHAGCGINLFKIVEIHCSTGGFFLLFLELSTVTVAHSMNHTCGCIIPLRYLAAVLMHCTTGCIHCVFNPYRKDIKESQNFHVIRDIFDFSRYSLEVE